MRFGDVNVMRIYESSNIDPSVQQAIVSAWVVLETRATIGKSLTQLADYAAAARPGDGAAGRARRQRGDDPRVVRARDRTAAPAELTEFDRAYLKSLYRVQARGRALQQVHQMADSIARENEKAAP